MTVFICKDCVFLCNYESDYKRHLKTKKHIKNAENENSKNKNNNVVIASKMNKKSNKKSSKKDKKSSKKDLIYFFYIKILKTFLNIKLNFIKVKDKQT